MATIVSSLFMSLDGVVEIDPASRFPYFDEHMGAAVCEDYEGVDALLLGRVTYDSFAGAWPDREAAGGEDATFAAQLGDTRKVVATRGEQDPGWRNVEAVHGDLIEAVTAFGAEPGIGKILVAGASGSSTRASRCTRFGCCVRRPSRRVSFASSTRRVIFPALRRTTTSPTRCRARARAERAGPRVERGRRRFSGSVSLGRKSPRRCLP